MTRILEKTEEFDTLLTTKAEVREALKLFKLHSEKQKVTLNLIDTMGYENYEKPETSKEELLTFYKELITNAMVVDEYKQGVKKDDNFVPKIASNMQAEAIREGRFIRNSLEYIEKMLIKYNDMQKKIKRTLEQEKSTKLKSNFFEKLNNIKQMSSNNMPSESWLAEFLPQHSTAIVLAAFKANMNSTEISSAEETLNFVKKLNV